MGISQLKFLSLHSFSLTLRQNRGAINKEFLSGKLLSKSIHEENSRRRSTYGGIFYLPLRISIIDEMIHESKKLSWFSSFSLHISSTLKIAKFIGPLTLIKCFHVIYGHSDNALWKLYRVE